MMYIYKGIMLLVVVNNHGIVMMGVHINNHSLFWLHQVLSDYDCLNYWLDDWFHHNWLDNWLNNWLLLNIHCAMLLCVDDCFFLNHHVTVVVSLEEDLSSDVAIVEDVPPASNSVVVGQMSNLDYAVSQLK